MKSKCLAFKLKKKFSTQKHSQRDKVYIKC